MVQFVANFTRCAWVSDDARQTWQPKIFDCVRAWTEIEWRSVVAGYRECALHVLDSQEVMTFPATVANYGLSVLPVHVLASTKNGYSGTSKDTNSGNFQKLLCAVGHLDTISALKRAWDARNDIAVGKLLGYPDCCCAAFARTWPNAKDSIWRAAMQCKDAIRSERQVTVSGHLESNILLRWVGIRAVPHLPCSFDCEATRIFGQRLLILGNQLGFNQQMTNITEMLDWPIEWSALHGIAQIHTPILKVTTNTDYTPLTLRVRWPGSRYPKEGARGLHFPYAPSEANHIKSKNPRSSVAAELEQIRTNDELYFYDNGFSSFQAMLDAHKPLVECAKRLLGGCADDQPRVVDFGCGNGALLRAIIGQESGWKGVGVDIEHGKIARATAVFTQKNITYLLGNVLDSAQQMQLDIGYQLSIVMAGVLLEAEEPMRTSFLRRLRRQSSVILLYAYPDYVRKAPTIFSNPREFDMMFGSKVDATEEYSAEVFVRLIRMHGRSALFESSTNSIQSQDIR